MVPQRIEREIVIHAPVEVVWSVVTEPEHISAWFSDSADLDLRPGGRAVLHWNDFGTVLGRVERHRRRCRIALPARLRGGPGPRVGRPRASGRSSRSPRAGVHCPWRAVWTDYSLTTASR